MTQREVDAVNRSCRVGILTDGSSVELIDFFDVDGEACEPGYAVACTATDGALWWSVDLTAFDRMRSN